MEVKNNMVTSKYYTREEEEEDEMALPGFRFHPTDEELVGFYLRRKVEKRPINIELIKQIDIYKYEPWDLPKSSNMGEKEWYFFCKRGRKYRNSVRPNRVTGCGFWKATGIDKPIYNCSDECIGLKKSLVYYRGSAGKGTKTDWMMHEFRLPAENDKSTKHIDAKTIAQEAEVWTLCRIFKRNKCSVAAEWKIAAAKRNPAEWKIAAAKRNPAEWRAEAKRNPAEWRAEAKRNPEVVDSQTCSADYIISFGTAPTHDIVHQDMITSSTNNSTQQPSSDMNFELLLKNNYWDELTSILDLDRY